jgi:hypothetical protein
MPRVALPDSLQLCRISGCLYTPFIQKTNIFLQLHRRQFWTLQLQLRPLQNTFSCDACFKICQASPDTGSY